MKITYYDDTVVLMPESQAEVIQLQEIDRMMWTDPVLFSHELFSRQTVDPIQLVLKFKKDE